MGTGAHPSDADREATARPAVLRILEALRRGEPELSRPYWRDDVVWLGPEGRADGPDAVVRRLGALGAGGAAWSQPVQHGAHAVLRRTGGPGAHAGGLVIETRRGLGVLVVALP